jgi:DNA-binding LacI/PurR family transcriptional regulator
MASIQGQFACDDHPRSKMNIREIARRAKVSTATVSRAINRIPTVDPLLARRVWRVVDEFGYYPNTQARALVSGKSRIFGLVVSELTNPFFPEIVQTFEELAVQNNYELLLTSTVHNPKRMKSAVRRMIERRVDGVAILTFGTEESLLVDLLLRKVAVVFVDAGPNVSGLSNIRIDYQNGIRQAIQHLAALRHTDIAFVAGPLHFKSAVARKEAFQKSMEEIGLEVPPGMIVVGDHTPEGGMRAIGDLMRSHKRPTSVVCSNDMTAVGVIRGAYDLGLNIPDDLSVVGFDDIRLSQFILPPLTTVQMSQAELARIAFTALMDAVAQESLASVKAEYRLTTSLVLRRSTTMKSTRPQPIRHRTQSVTRP